MLKLTLFLLKKPSMNKYIKSLLLCFTSIVIKGQVTNSSKSYTFDNLNRLTKTIYSNGETHQYFYDKLGNRVGQFISLSCVLPSAFLYGDQTIDEGDNATLSVAFSGTQPYTFGVDGVTYSNINNESFNFDVNPVSTQTYSISEIRNACGIGTPGGNATVTVIPMVLLPDLIIESAYPFDYQDNKVWYTVVVRNIGNQTADMSSFLLGTLASNDQVLDISDTDLTNYSSGFNFNLDPGRTFTMWLYSPIDYASNEHYFILLSDFTSVITESDEDNNQKVLLIKKCTDSDTDDVVLSGVLDQNYYAAKGKMTISHDAEVSENTVITGASVVGLPNMTANQNDITILKGTCVKAEDFGGNGSGDDNFGTASDGENVKVITPSLKDDFKFEISNPSHYTYAYGNNSTLIKNGKGSLAKKSEEKVISIPHDESADFLMLEIDGNKYFRQLKKD